MIILTSILPPIPWPNPESQPVKRNKARRVVWSLTAQSLAQTCSPYSSLFHFETIFM